MKNIKLNTLLYILILVFGFNCTKTSTSTTTSLPEINALNNKPVGASANDLLSANNYTSINVEIQYMPGFQPDATAINNLKSFITSLVNKPAGVTVTQTQIAASGQSTFTLNDIATFEKNNRSSFTNNNQLSVYFLYIDGKYSQNNVLGIAYRNTSLCIMGKTIQENSGGIGQVSRAKLESTVLEHEMAHILGLVDIGSPMQTNHKDAANGNHCSNNSCLMYYASETTDVLGVLLTGNIPALDANCKADLTANGGK